MIKKFFIILFNVLGFLTFLALVSAAAFLGIRHYKSQAITEATTTADTIGVIRTISMTPEKTDNLATPSQTLPHFQPTVSATKTKPVHQVTRKPDTPVSAPTMYAEPKVTRTITVENSKPEATKPTVAKHKPKSQKPRPATTTHADLGIPEEPQRRYQVTDRTASPRTGSRIPDVYAPPSELEQQAIRHARNIRQLEEETAKLRTPPIEETGLMKLLSGGK